MINTYCYNGYPLSHTATTTTNVLILCKYFINNKDLILLQSIVNGYHITLTFSIAKLHLIFFLLEGYYLHVLYWHCFIYNVAFMSAQFSFLSL